MSIEPRLDIIGAALADPSRSRILCELMDGRAFTNKELAAAAQITAQTASAHLGQLTRAGLVTSLRSGRCVYYRIANEQVASVLEGLASLSPTDHLTRHPSASEDTRLARSCYNHLAGQLGVSIAEGLVKQGILIARDGVFAPGPHYTDFCDRIGLKVPATPNPCAKPCLDWTERRPHLSGPFATAFFNKALDEGWLSRRTGSRALDISNKGRQVFETQFGLSPDVLPAPA